MAAFVSSVQARFGLVLLGRDVISSGGDIPTGGVITTGGDGDGDDVDGCGMDVSLGVGLGVGDDDDAGGGGGGMDNAFASCSFFWAACSFCCF